MGGRRAKCTSWLCAISSNLALRLSYHLSHICQTHITHYQHCHHLLFSVSPHCYLVVTYHKPWRKAPTCDSPQNRSVPPPCCLFLHYPGGRRKNCASLLTQSAFFPCRRIPIIPQSDTPCTIFPPPLFVFIHPPPRRAISRHFASLRPVQDTEHDALCSLLELGTELSLHLFTTTPPPCEHGDMYRFQVLFCPITPSPISGIRFEEGMYSGTMSTAIPCSPRYL